MAGSTRRLRLFTGVALSTFVLALGTGGSAKAEATDAQIKALQAQVEVLMRTVKELKDAQTHTAADAKAAKKHALEADANSAQAKATAEDARRRSKKAKVQTGWLDRDGHSYFQHKPGKALTFFTPERRDHGLRPIRRLGRRADEERRQSAAKRQFGAGRKFWLAA